MYTQERSLKQIHDLKLPEMFSKLLEGQKTFNSFDLFFKIPHGLYLAGSEEQKNMIPEGYEPLFSDGNFSRIYCYSTKNRNFTEIIVEGGGLGKIYKTFNHFSAEIIKQLWELEWDDEINAFTDALNFKYANDCIDFFEKNNNQAGYDEYSKKFILFLDNLLP